MPKDYVQMMQMCWDVDPSKRPTIQELHEFSDNKLKEIYEGKIDFNNNNSNINSGSSSSNSPRAHKKHPSAYHTSRILDDEIAKLNLKSNDSLLSDLDINSIII